LFSSLEDKTSMLICLIFPKPGTKNPWINIQDAIYRTILLYFSLICWRNGRISYLADRKTKFSLMAEDFFTSHTADRGLFGQSFPIFSAMQVQAR
jgi:hypothetical protein